MRKTDRMIGTFFQFIFYIEEMEWAIEEALKTGLPLATTMAICEKGDMAGVPAGECAVRMAKAGARVGEWDRMTGQQVMRLRCLSTVLSGVVLLTLGYQVVTNE